MPLHPKQNEPLSSLTHLIGALLSVAGLVLMVVFAATYGRASDVVGASIFGSSLIMLYVASALFHFFAQGTRAKRLFQRLDHACIFALIAGTYTPITLALPQRGWGWSLFGAVWGCALLGIALKASGRALTGWRSPALYVCLGWTALLAWPQLSAWLPRAALGWLLLGGACYSIGAVFYALDPHVRRTRWFGMHELFHVFVMAGSFCHFWLVMRYVSRL